MQLVEIGKNDPLKPGDRLQIEIKQRFSMGETIDSYLLATSIYNVEKNHPEFTILGWDYKVDSIVLRIVVNDAANDPKVAAAGVLTPAVIISLVVGVSVMALSVTIFKVSNDVAQIAQTPAGQVATGFLPIVLITVTAFAGVYLWKKTR